MKNIFVMMLLVLMGTSVISCERKSVTDDTGDAIDDALDDAGDSVEDALD